MYVENKTFHTFLDKDDIPVDLYSFIFLVIFPKDAKFTWGVAISTFGFSFFNSDRFFPYISKKRYL